MAESPVRRPPVSLSLVGRHGTHDSPKGFPYLDFGEEGKKEEKKRQERDLGRGRISGDIGRYSYSTGELPNTCRNSFGNFNLFSLNFRPKIQYFGILVSF